MPINCTLTYKHLANDTEDVSGDIGAIPAIGPVYAEAQFADDAAALGSDATGYTIRRFTGYLDTDGILKNERGGTVGMRVWANDPLFNLERLPYKVTFDLYDALGRRIELNGTTFDAPSTDTTVPLTNVLPVPGAMAGGILRRSSYAEDVLDIGVTGHALVIAQTAAAARAAIGVDLIDLDEWRWYDSRAAFPATGSNDVVYGARDNGGLYRWNGVDDYMPAAATLLVDGVPVTSYDIDTTPATASDVGAYTTAQVDDAISAGLSSALTKPFVLTGTCATAIGTAAKTVTLDAPWNAHTPLDGEWFLIRFTNGQSNSSPTLSINGATARAIMCPTGSTSSASLQLGGGISTLFRYNGADARFETVGATQNTTYAAIAAVDLLNPAGTNQGLISGERAEALLAAEAAVTRTLTHKRVAPRVTPLASAATLTPDSDASDEVVVTGLAVNATIAAPTGTPVSGQPLRISITDDGNARLLTWNAAYVFRRPTLAPANVAGSAVYADFVWNASTSKWDCVSTNSGKRSPRNSTVTTATSIAPSADTTDFFDVPGLATDLTINALAGTPGPGQPFTFRIKDDGTAHAMAWNAVYVPIGVTLPVATTAGKWMYVFCVYNNNASKWDVTDVKVQA